jgi:hypothetical protein
MVKELKEKKRRLREFKRRIEFETDICFLESLKLELKQAKKHEKLQRRIWKKKGWREYTV